jgi:magnesium transporter
VQNGRLRQIQIEDGTDLERTRPIWIDFDAPTDDERLLARELFSLTLPDEDDFGDIEASARCFEDATGALQIRSDFLLDKADESRNVPVAFVLKQDILFSLHEEDLPVFRLLRMRARHQPGYLEDCRDVLLDLYATDAEYSADALEGVYADLEEVGGRVLKAHLTDEAAAEVLAGIARQEDLNGRIRRNLMDTRRAISFLMRRRLLSADQIEEARQILRDIESLDGHTSFLFEKINFLMDATVGFININQNKIIKIFSVASVALLPPTLIASIYGMNFEFMPELKWGLGYPFALGIMVASIIAPFWFFRRKGWLK